MRIFRGLRTITPVKPSEDLYRFTSTNDEGVYVLFAAHRNDTFDVRKKEWEAAQEFSHNIPVSRGEAIILEKTLEELLPAGMVTTALRTGACLAHVLFFQIGCNLSDEFILLF